MESQNEAMKFKNKSHLSIGRLGEYWTKFALTLYGFDVYTSEVDDKGIDFIVRTQNGKYFDIQVKSIRFPNTNYVFLSKKGEWEEAKLRENLILALVLFVEDELPKLYLIPSTEWKNPNDLLRDRNYGKKDQKSKPEWGIDFTKKALKILENYSIENKSNINY